MSRLNGVVCYWKYQKPKDMFDECWVLAESYPIDDDGYPLVKPKTTKGRGGRREPDAWLNRIGREGGYTPIMGRAVTIWNFTSGPWLYGIHPPAWVDWMVRDLTRRLAEDGSWKHLLAGGLSMSMQTAMEAERIFREWDPED